MEGTQWRVDSNHNSIMAVGNGGAKPVTAVITLFYDQGTKQYGMEKQIDPDSQVWVNFADLIQNRIPDKDGNVLPEDTKSGTYSIQVISHPLQAVLYEGKVITDKTYGHATYGCIICCGYDSTGFDPYTAYGSVDATTTVSAMGTNTCTNISQSIDDFFSTWWPSNASIFTMSVGSMTGVSVGTGTTNASTTTLPVGGQGMDRPPYCPQRPAVNQGTGTVQVPTSLSVLSVTLLPNGQGLNFGCSGLANYGIMVDTKYQVLDQNGAPIQSANMTPHEKGIGFGGSPYDKNIGPSGFTNSTATTAADGTFHDVPFGVCGNGAFTSVSATQNITMIMPDGSTPAVRSQSFTATGQSAGHGTLKNSISSPGTGSDISATR